MFRIPPEFSVELRRAPVRQLISRDGLLVSLTDANNHATSFAYDGFDRLATTTYSLGSGLRAQSHEAVSVLTGRVN